MSIRLRPRWIYLVIFLACLGLMGFGLYLQHVERLEPCPLCILQRYAFVLVGSISLVAAIHGPRKAGAWVYGPLLVLSAGSGAAIAARQAWLQHHPPKVLDCGPDLAYLLESLPLTQVLPKVFKGEGDCAAVVWSFLGLSIAEWALAWFVAFIAAAILALMLTRRRA